MSIDLIDKSKTNYFTSKYFFNKIGFKVKNTVCHAERSEASIERFIHLDRFFAMLRMTIEVLDIIHLHISTFAYLHIKINNLLT